jgi:hypothetical protein
MELAGVDVHLARGVLAGFDRDAVLVLLAAGVGDRAGNPVLHALLARWLVPGGEKWSSSPAARS